MFRACALAIALAAASTIVAVAGCSVDHLSGGFACNGSQDCPVGRTCSGGFCIVSTDDGGVGADAPSTSDGGMPHVDAREPIDASHPADADQCPSACTSCDPSSMTCEIACGDGPQCQGTISCPSGWSCVIDCASPSSCANIQCTSDTACTISCSGTNSCNHVTCGQFPSAVGDTSCNVICSGTDSCSTVDCQNACACDVKCRPQADCGTLDCPNGQLCELTDQDGNVDGCTSQGGGGGGGGPGGPGGGGNGGVCDTCFGTGTGPGHP